MTGEFEEIGALHRATGVRLPAIVPLFAGERKDGASIVGAGEDVKQGFCGRIARKCRGLAL